jgi:hypothetical protein
VVEVASSKPLTSITLDTGLFVDFVPGDNQWKAPQ